MNDVIGDSPPLIAVEPKPFIAIRGLVDSELGFNDVGVVTTFLERKAALRRAGELGVAVPFLDFRGI
jgi:hypothetical protein